MRLRQGGQMQRASRAVSRISRSRRTLRPRRLDLSVAQVSPTMTAVVAPALDAADAEANALPSWAVPVGVGVALLAAFFFFKGRRKVAVSSGV